MQGGCEDDLLNARIEASPGDIVVEVGAVLGRRDLRGDQPVTAVAVDDLVAVLVLVRQLRHGLFQQLLPSGDTGGFGGFIGFLALLFA